MVRARYQSRAAGAPQNGGTLYRAAPRPKAAREVLVIPVTGDLVECPVCHGGVKTVKAPYSDPDAGVVQYKTPVYGSHRFGGEPGGKQDKCAGSHSALREEST